MTERTCSKCGEAKQPAEFVTDRQRRDGLSSWCKACKNATTRQWYSRQPAEIYARNRVWVEANRERVRELQRKHVEANRDKLRQRARDAYVSNPERARGYTAKWRATSPHAKVYAREQSHRRRARQRSAQVLPFTREQVEQRVAMYGGRCWICSSPYEQIDHVKPIAKGGAHILANLRPICAPCNTRKRAKWPLSEEVIRSLLLHSQTHS